MKKIIHIDMDCFYAAIEIRDNPTLANKPVAVGGSVQNRGVLATCNYIARKYGLHSAMPTARAFQLCPNLVLLPGNMQKYKSVAKKLYCMFRQYTPLVETLSLDEAYLDVTNCPYCKGSATLIAKTIRNRIKKDLHLTASAGVAPNKLLAKIASEWNKPDGLFVITPEQVDEFMPKLPVGKIYGVGKVTEKHMADLKIYTCGDLQKRELPYLIENFGKFGHRLYELCRGIDNREVETEYTPKSLSVEETFAVDLKTSAECLAELPALIKELKRRLAREDDFTITKQIVKIKFYDFTRTSVEKTVSAFDENRFAELLTEGLQRQNKPVRLIGVGVKFAN
jgi:DNA polymerase-4